MVIRIQLGEKMLKVKDYSKYKIAKIDGKKICLFKESDNFNYYSFYSDVIINVEIKIVDNSLFLKGEQVHHNFYDYEEPNKESYKKYHPSELKRVMKKKYVFFGKMVERVKYASKKRMKRLLKTTPFYIHTNVFKIIIEDEK